MVLAWGGLAFEEGNLHSSLAGKFAQGSSLMYNLAGAVQYIRGMLLRLMLTALLQCGSCQTPSTDHLPHKLLKQQHEVMIHGIDY